MAYRSNSRLAHSCRSRHLPRHLDRLGSGVYATFLFVSVGASRGRHPNRRGWTSSVPDASYPTMLPSVQSVREQRHKEFQQSSPKTRLDATFWLASPMTFLCSCMMSLYCCSSCYFVRLSSFFPRVNLNLSRKSRCFCTITSCCRSTCLSRSCMVRR